MESLVETCARALVLGLMQLPHGNTTAACGQRTTSIAAHGVGGSRRRDAEFELDAPSAWQHIASMVPTDLKMLLFRMLAGYHAVTGLEVSHLLDCEEMSGSVQSLSVAGCSLLPGSTLAAALAPRQWPLLHTLCLKRLVTLQTLLAGTTPLSASCSAATRSQTST